MSSPIGSVWILWSKLLTHVSLHCLWCIGRSNTSHCRTFVWCVHHTEMTIINEFIEKLLFEMWIVAHAWHDHIQIHFPRASIDQFFTVTVVEYFFFLFDLSHTLIVIATRFYISNPVGFICLDCGLDVSVVTIVPNILMSFHLMHIHTN